MRTEMRRTKQLLSAEETVAMLEAATSGVLALLGEDGYPYAVPLSFVYDQGRLYFHSATAGHKLAAIAHNDTASFCVIADDEVVPSTFTTHYRSAIVFGHMRVVEEDAEKRHALMRLAEKYSPDHLASADGEIERSWSRMCALALDIEQLSGKAAIEVIKRRSGEAQTTD